MDTWVWIVIGVIVAIVVLGVVFSALRTRRSRSLQDQFGPEYDRTVERQFKSAFKKSSGRPRIARPA